MRLSNITSVIWCCYFVRLFKFHEPLDRQEESAGFCGGCLFFSGFSLSSQQRAFCGQVFFLPAVACATSGVYGGTDGSLFSYFRFQICAFPSVSVIIAKWTKHIAYSLIFFKLYTNNCTQTHTHRQATKHTNVVVVVFWKAVILLRTKKPELIIKVN